MNTRTDIFGGSIENSTRFALMLAKALKKSVPEMVIDYKLPVVTPERGKCTKSLVYRLRGQRQK